jgi:general secretion pathway protein D
VLIDVAVLEVDRNLTRTLGVTPPGSTSITFANPPGGTSNSISIKDLDKIGSGNFYITIPSTSIDAFATRTNAKVLQNPSLRSSDGKKASLRVGTKQPVAQGSFQPTFAGNIGGTPVVNFTYIDVGVNLDLTPRVLLNREIAITTKVEVNAISGFEEFGGGTGGTIKQPILTQRSVEHDIRLKEGESNIIGGIIQDNDAVTISGVPGANRVPLLRYLFSKESKTRTENEIIIIITPHILRLPEYLDDDYESIALLGAGNNPRLVGRPVALLGDNPIVGKAPQAGTNLPTTSKGPAPSSSSNSRTPSPTTPSYPAPRLAFVRLALPNGDVAAGSRVAVSASIENAQNASALTFNLSFNPKVLKLVDVQNGGFLSSDGKIIALAPKIENENGRAVISLTRPPDSSGLNGKGVLVNLFFEAVNSGSSPISFTEASNVRDNNQTTLPTSFTSTQVVVK